MTETVKLPSAVLDEINEWVATVAPASARKELRTILVAVARIAYRMGKEEKKC